MPGGMVEAERGENGCTSFSGRLCLLPIMFYRTVVDNKKSDKEYDWVFHITSKSPRKMQKTFVFDFYFYFHQ